MLNEQPKPSLLSAEQLQLRTDTRVGFLCTALRHVFSVFTPFFLWPYVKWPRSSFRYGFASQGVSQGQMITRSAGNHAASLPLVCTEIWWWTSTAYTDVAVC